MLVVMALGVVVIAGTIAWRLGGTGGTLTPVQAITADAVALPADLSVTAIGGDGPYLLVLGRDASGAEILVTLRKSDGTALSRTPVLRTP